MQPFPSGGWWEVQGGSRTDAAPGATVFNNRLYVFDKGINDDQIYVNSALVGEPFAWVGKGPGGRAY